MKNRDELEGKSESLKGRAKQALGDLTNDERLRDQGAAEEAKGEAQATVGKARRKVGEAVEDIGHQIKR